MSMLKWAEHEVEYALKEALGTDDTDDLSFVYYKSCLDSALKAFKSLCEDNHSGMSISITKNILMRLIESKPLTVIDDTEDGWNKVAEREDDGSECYQNKRMPSLFKNVDANGKVEYDDLDRCVCKDINSGLTYYDNLASQYLNKNYPITMPYYPSDKPFVFYIEDFCLDRPDAIGCYTYKALISMSKPDGTKEDLYLYYRENESGDMVQISGDEYRRDWMRTMAKKGEE